MDVTTTPNRRQRRGIMRFQGLSGGMYGKLSYSAKAEVRASNLERGRKLHEANVDAVDKSRFEQLEDIEARKIETWKEISYNKKEIKMLSEAWSISVVGKATREEKKERRQLLSDAKASLLSRRK